MTGETPAEHLARLKLTYPTWRFWRGEATGDYWAMSPDRERLLSAATVTELEAKVIEAQHG